MKTIHANIVNLCPHDITIMRETGKNEFEEIVRILPSGTVARCNSKTEKHGYLKLPEKGLPSIQLTETSYYEVMDLPEPKEGVIYVVSSLVAEAMRNSGRTDIRIINGTIRGPQGEILGGRSLGMIPPVRNRKIEEYCKDIRSVYRDADDTHSKIMVNTANTILKLSN